MTWKHIPQSEKNYHFIGKKKNHYEEKKFLVKLLTSSTWRLFYSFVMTTTHPKDKLSNLPPPDIYGSHLCCTLKTPLLLTRVFCALGIILQKYP